MLKRAIKDRIMEAAIRCTGLAGVSPGQPLRSSTSCPGTGLGLVLGGHLRWQRALNTGTRGTSAAVVCSFWNTSTVQAVKQTNWQQQAAFGNAAAVARVLPKNAAIPRATPHTVGTSPGAQVPLPVAAPSTTSASPSGHPPLTHAAPAARTAGNSQPLPLPEAASPPQTPWEVRPLASGPLILEGLVQKVQFRSADTAYSVLRVQVTTTAEMETAVVAAGAQALFKGKGRAGGSGSGRRRGPAGGKGAPLAADGVAAGGFVPRKLSVVVVGSLPQVAIGQQLRFSGEWAEHKQYGWQFRATDIQEMTLNSDCELVAYLGGGVIPGVGPVIAQRLVARWGSEVERVLDSPTAAVELRQCEGIGARTAERIKAGWDMNKGTREGVLFLREHGVPVAQAQRVAEQWGPGTKALVARDPYLALSGLGLSLRRVDQLAAGVAASPDLVSRAGLALGEVLRAAAAEQGHAYLTWAQLEPAARKLLKESGDEHGHPWMHSDSLHLVAQHMHATASGLVAEPPLLPPRGEAFGMGHEGTWREGSCASAAAPSSPGQAQQGMAGVVSQSGRSSALRTHPELSTEADAKEYLRAQISGLSDALAQSMLDTYGPSILVVLDSPPKEAIEKLQHCRKIGPKSAEKFKTQWDASFGVDARGRGTVGLRVEEVTASPPELSFEWGPGTRCYLPYLHQAEQTVAEVILQKAAAYHAPTAASLQRIRAWLDQDQRGAEMELSAGQRAAIEMASSAPILVVTGGPGCGKTSTVQTIVKLWGAQKKLVSICAPTGRAAQRIGTIQGIEPCTIHRLLRYQPRRASSDSSQGQEAGVEDPGLGDGGGFEYSRENPLPAKAVLVDEASMLSLPLAAALLGALDPGCQLVLVGDVDQLPPVGPGSVLQSLIGSGLVPVVDLREIFRQAAQSSIVTSSVAVRQGQLPVLTPVRPEHLDAAPSDALWVEATSSEDVPAAMQHTVRALLRSSKFGGPEHLQVITPMRKGPTGTAHLNPMLQLLLNPPHPSRQELPRQGGASVLSLDGGQQHAHRIFRVGDRVIQQVNNYDKDVFNGDQGKIVQAAPELRKLVVRFPKVPTEGNPRDYVDLDYQGHELHQLELAYAITVHKAQGGEAQHVVLLLSHHHSRMLTRRLLYTGLTRAKQQLIVVSPGGGHNPVATAVRRTEEGARLSSLESRLVEGRQRLGLDPRQPWLFSNESEILHQHCVSSPALQSLAQQQWPDAEHPAADFEAGERAWSAPRQLARVGATASAQDVDGEVLELVSGHGSSPTNGAVLRSPSPSTQDSRLDVQGAEVQQNGLQVSPAAASNAAFLLGLGLSIPKVQRLYDGHPAGLELPDLQSRVPANLAVVAALLGTQDQRLLQAKLADHTPQLLFCDPQDLKQRAMFLEGTQTGAGSRWKYEHVNDADCPPVSREASSLQQASEDRFTVNCEFSGGLLAGLHEKGTRLDRQGLQETMDGSSASILDQLMKLKAIMEIQQRQAAARASTGRLKMGLRQCS